MEARAQDDTRGAHADYATNPVRERPYCGQLAVGGGFEAVFMARDMSMITGRGATPRAAYRDGYAALRAHEAGTPRATTRPDGDPAQ